MELLGSCVAVPTWTAFVCALGRKSESGGDPVDRPWTGSIWEEPKASRHMNEHLVTKIPCFLFALDKLIGKCQNVVQSAGAPQHIMSHDVFVLRKLKRSIGRILALWEGEGFASC